MNSRKVAKAFVLIIFSMLLALILIVELSYRYIGNVVYDGSSEIRWSSLVKDAIWASFDECSPRHITMLNPYSIIYSKLRGHAVHGEKIIVYVSNKYLESKKAYSQRMLVHHLQLFFCGIWISRNWTTDNIIWAAGNNIILDNVCGIDNIAYHYFQKDTNALSADEIALIMSTARGGFVHNVNLRTEELQLRRNLILERMFRNGAINERELSGFTDQPISRSWTLIK